LDHYDTTGANIELFLKDKTRKLRVMLETAKPDFERFWRAMGAEGDLTAALAEWDIAYNSRTEIFAARAARREIRRQATIARVVAKLARIVVGFPDYLRSA